jgi:C4-dicarboxylate-specific signal transduction histidine kinase
MYVCLDVTDTGPGLGPETRLRLFRQPFFTAKPRHYGLGLTILHSIVSAQQGGIMLFELPTGGLAARVYIPILNTTAAHDSASERRTAL